MDSLGYNNYNSCDYMTSDRDKISRGDDYSVQIGEDGTVWYFVWKNKENPR